MTVLKLLGHTSQGFLQPLGPGRPLSPATRAKLKPHVGQDLEGARVHTGPQAEPPQVLRQFLLRIPSTVS